MSIENKTIDVNFLRSIYLKDLLSDKFSDEYIQSFTWGKMFVSQLISCIRLLPAVFTLYVYNSCDLPIYFCSNTSKPIIRSLSAVKFCFDCIFEMYPKVNDESYVDVETLQTAIFNHLYLGGEQ